MTIPELYTLFMKCGTVTTDSRTVCGGEMFFALKGENFDGNRYALKALEAGAAYAVVEISSEVASDSYPEDMASRIIPVEDTLKTLQELARWHRSMTFVDGRPLTVIALTGTNGKTTTKELIREVLSRKYCVTATEGNLNNNIGVPLTLLKINAKTQIAVVEMGASHPGDIKELVDIALPNYGLITNVGKAHLLGFGSFEGVMATKGELYDYLRRTGDRIFLNADNPYLCRMASERNMHNDPERKDSLAIPYGLKYQSGQVLPSSSEYPFLRISLPEPGSDAGDSVALRTISTDLIGSYNADNVMAALAVGMHFGVSFDDAVSAIEGYHPSNNRSQLIRTERNTLIVDAYNANPTSMDAALDNFSHVEAGHKSVMLGNMLELGEDSLQEHVRVIEKTSSLGLDRICLVGEEFRKALQHIHSCDVPADSIYESGNLVWAPASDILAQWLSDQVPEGSVILIKGSRGSRMENVIPVL